MINKETTTVGQYLADFNPELRERLQQVRKIILQEVPDAEECISYGMPTYRRNGNLIHFGGFTRHIGLYPTPSGISEFATRLQPYTFAKGSVRFPHDLPLPIYLIRDIVRFRAAENISTYRV
jgi:uncharacterized protein YdhG (YjbR/CyaY superfamily)